MVAITDPDLLAKVQKELVQVETDARTIDKSLMIERQGLIDIKTAKWEK